MKLVIADDELPLLKFLQKGLVAEGHQVTAVSDFHSVVPTIKQEIPELVVLDRMFGASDSVELLPAIKGLSEPPLVLILTALDEVDERIKGLQEGADDYLCKPFDFDELLARISALSRRAVRQERFDKHLSLGPLQLKLEERLVMLNGTEVPMTKLEYDVMHYLLLNVGKVVSRERILGRVWQMHSDPQTNVVDVYISRLRKKVDAEPTLFIETIRGNGYRLSHTPE